MNKESKTKALLLFSGGLDSMLAGMILKEQGIEVLGLTFVSPFFGAETAKKSAEEIGIKLRIIDFTEKHLKMLKNSKHGYGKNMNPCIDCHALMFKIAKEIMLKEKFDFVATGEVLGERPMSQNKEALKIVEKEAGLQGFLLRPLSAKLLLETEAEKTGKIKREKLLAISGKNRRSQLKLVKKYKIKKFPTPSGGCLLTEKIFSQNLKKLFENKPKADENDIELIKNGRQVWKGRIKFVVGRDQKENENLKKLKTKKDFLVEAQEVPGPVILVRNYSADIIGKKNLEKNIINLLLKYNAKARKIKNISVNWLES